MSILPTDDAIARFKANEERVDIFVNDPLSTGYYTTNETVPRQVKTLPELADGIVESASLRADLVSNTAGKGAALVAFIGPDGNPYTVADLASDATGKGDALLRTKQPYTGAVSRTQHDKNAEWLSVKDFGAIGDGITDDTTAMNIAATQAAAQKKSLFVPDGVYKMTAPWVIPVTVYVKGESPAYYNMYDPAGFRNNGAVIYKAHTGDGVRKIGTEAYHNGAPIENICVTSHRANFPAGSGFVLDKVSNCHLIRCNVFSVAGDAYVLGVTAGDVTGHNYIFNNYSNNPGGVHYRIRQKWGRYHYPVGDGGTIGMFFDSSPMSEVDGFHFEGFTTVGIYITSGSQNLVLTGRGFLGCTVGNAVKGIHITNDSGNDRCIIENVHFAGENYTGSRGILISGPSANGTKIKNCYFHNWDTAIEDKGSYGNSGTHINNCNFDSCYVGVVANSDYYNYTENQFTNTGIWPIWHVAGTHGLWSGNTFDKNPNPALSGVAGNFSGVCVKNNIGYLTRNKGSVSVATGANIAHGLVGKPKDQIVLTCSSSGITSFPQLVALDATNFVLVWSGTSPAIWNWEASCPCDF